MSIVRVSTLEGFRWWQNSDLDWEWYLNREKEGANEKMLAGTAFHKFMETIRSGEFDSFQQDGHTFVFDCSVDVALPQISEIRTSKQYGNLTVTGKCDGLSGLTISDYKLIIGHAIDGEQYMESYQWRYYLDLFEANIFRYIVFEAREMEGESPIPRITKSPTFTRCFSTAIPAFEMTANGWRKSSLKRCGNVQSCKA